MIKLLVDISVHELSMFYDLHYTKLNRYDSLSSIRAYWHISLFHPDYVTLGVL